MAIVAATIVASCARMGQPDGGWYDETPPRVIGASPADRATNAMTKKVTILFNEFIKLDNATEKVVVSPPQLEQAEVKASGKRIEVKLNDTLRANTTYTIDFSDAISDNNEGNPLGNYTYSFATGPEIDTLEVAGCVLQADNLEPVKGILVGLYRDFADSTFTHQPMLRVARTDSHGRFVVRGVAPGSYRAYALADADGDFKFSQKSEMIAFSRDTITPRVIDDTRQDTIWQDSLRIKEINRVGYRHFLPDDIVLKAFGETLTDRYLIKSERKEADHFTLYFSYGSDSLPSVRGLNFDSRDAFIVEPTPRGDTISYWLRDTALVNTDTLEVELRYMMTDSTGVLVSQTDTLTMLSKQPYAQRMKKLAKERTDWEKAQAKLRKRGEPYDSVMPLPTLTMNVDAPADLPPDRNVYIRFATPIARADTSRIHLYAKHDSLWYRARYELRVLADTALVPDSMAARDLPLHRAYELRAEWRPDIEYSLELDSMAFVDIYGMPTKKHKNGFKVPSADKFGSLLLDISGVSGRQVVVELLDSSDKPVKRTVVTDGQAQFFYIKEGTYYARLILDDNRNGRWDTGDYATGTQPETVCYYPDKIECCEKWYVTRQWNPFERPADRQKPADITKQKGDKQRKVQQRNLKRAQQMGIDYVPKM